MKYMGKYIQCHVRQDLTLSIKLLSKSFPELVFYIFAILLKSTHITKICACNTQIYSAVKIENMFA